MKTIWKFSLAKSLDVPMPRGATIVSVQLQEGFGLCIWAIVDSEAEQRTRHFVQVGTGHPIAEYLEYVGTWQELPFVWHLFEDFAKP